MIEVREYTSAAEMRAAYSKLRAKFYAPAPKPNPAAEVPKQLDPDVRKPLFKWVPPEPTVVEVVPDWRMASIWFDAHVIDFRLHQLKKERIVYGDTDMPKKRLPILTIVLTVLKQFPDITVDDVRGPSQRDRSVRPRQIAMYEVRQKRPDLSYPAIGRWFGGRDHTTVIHAVRKIATERRATATEGSDNGR